MRSSILLAGASLAVLASAAEARPIHGTTPQVNISFNVGAKTPTGFGGISPDLQLCTIAPTIMTETDGDGNPSTDFVQNGDGAGGLTPQAAGKTYGQVGPAFGATGHHGPYTIVESCPTRPGLIVLTLNIVPNAVHITPISGGPHDDAGGCNQLGAMISRKQTANGGDADALVLGDTIYGRNGTCDPVAGNWQVRPPAGFWPAGSGPKITITSENWDTGTDANGNPNQGGGFQFGGGWTWSSAVSGSGVLPIIIDHVTCYFNGANGSSCLALSGPLRGLTVTHSRFQRGPQASGAVPVAIAAVAGGEVIDHNHFIYYQNGVVGGEGNGVNGNPVQITNNICEQMTSDCFTINGGDLTITNNLGGNYNAPNGAHPDFLQHVNWILSGTTTNYGVIAYNLNDRANPNPSVYQMTCTWTAATLTASSCSGDISAAGWKLGYGVDGLVTGTYSKNQTNIASIIDAHTFTVNNTSDPAGHPVKANGSYTVSVYKDDSQGIFLQGPKSGTSWVVAQYGAYIHNNISHNTAANDLALDHFFAPLTINNNDMLTDFNANSAAPGHQASAAISVGGGSGGNLNNNTTNVFGAAGQSGGPTNANTLILAKNNTAYTNVYPNYLTSCAPPNFNAACIINKFTPQASAANADGTFSTALWPPNDFGEVCWADPTTNWVTTGRHAHCTPAVNGFN